jgi:outer membrane protein with beta-barrel domain
MRDPARIAAITLTTILLLVSISRAQTVQWGAKAGVNRSSVNAVPDYYDWLLCCHPLVPDAMVDARPGAGFTGGLFAARPIRNWFGVQGDVLLSQKRHSVDLRPYEPIEVTFTRTYVEASGLAKLEFPTHIYIGSGPAFGFRVGAQASSSDASLKRGDPDTDIYAIQALIYGAPELLRKSQTSVVVAAGWVYRGFLVEVRLTQGLQSMFIDREGIVSAFVKVGGHEPTLRRLIADFGPFLESAKNRDLAVLAGFRF